MDRPLVEKHAAFIVGRPVRSVRDRPSQLDA